MKRTPYIDKAGFTSLFANPEANHEAICTTLHLLVAAVAAMPSLRPDREDLIDDAMQHATLHCIRRIKRFIYQPDANAFSYFTSVAMNALRDFRADAKRNRCRELWVDDGRWKAVA